MSDTSNGWAGSSLDDIFNNRDIWSQVIIQHFRIHQSK